MSGRELAPERTSLAWGRTALGAAGFGAALVRLGVAFGSAAELAAGAIALLCAGYLALVGRTTRNQRVAAPRRATARLTTGVVVTLGVLANTIILFHA